MSTLINILIIVSGIYWSIVYVESIRIGFKQKTYAMPLFALGLNIVWESVRALKNLELSTVCPHSFFGGLNVGS